MDGNDVSADHVIAELIDMGFEFVESIGAIEAVGPCLSDAVEFILNGFCRNNPSQTSFPCSTSQSKSFGQNSASFRAHQQSNTRCPVGHRVSSVNMNNNLDPVSESSRQDVRTCERPATSTPLVHENECFGLQKTAHLCSSYSQEAELDWEQKAGSILRKQFGFSSLKSFQKEALEAWVCHRDCLILAATGSGKSLCFQIPALLTGKVVVVISPLIPTVLLSAKP